MFNSKRVLGGKRAKYGGRSFESAFENMCSIQGVGLVRIPDSGKRVSARLFIQIVSPFDYCLAYRGSCAHVDTKTSDGATFSYSKINQSQLSNLLILRSGGPSGYVICMGDDNVYFADTDVLKHIMPHSGVDFRQCILLGNRISFDCRRIFSGSQT